MRAAKQRSERRKKRVFDLSKPNLGRDADAPYTVLHGQPGIGKTTFAVAPPGTIVADIERGIPGRNKAVPRFEISAAAELIAFLTQLRTENHPYCHVVIDTASRLNINMVNDVCREQNWLLSDGRNDMGEKGFGAYGRGEKVLSERWAEITHHILQLKQERNIAITVTAHTRIAKIRPPDKEEYTKYDIQLPAGAIEVVTQSADVVGFFTYPFTVVKDEKKQQAPGKAIGTDDVRLMLTNKPTHNAKNRFGMPPYITIPTGSPESGFYEYARYVPYWAQMFQQPTQQQETATPEVVTA
jgi:hypothetical protein